MTLKGRVGFLAGLQLEGKAAVKATTRAGTKVIPEWEPPFSLSRGVYRERAGVRCNVDFIPVSR